MELTETQRTWHQYIYVPVTYDPDDLRPSSAQAGDDQVQFEMVDEDREDDDV